MPNFVPTGYLYETHKNQGDKKWEIYAWAVRDIMAKVGGFGKHDISFKQRHHIYKYFNKMADSILPENSD